MSKSEWHHSHFRIFEIFFEILSKLSSKNENLRLFWQLIRKFNLYNFYKAVTLHLLYFEFLQGKKIIKEEKKSHKKDGHCLEFFSNVSTL